MERTIGVPGSQVQRRNTWIARGVILIAFPALFLAPTGCGVENEGRDALSSPTDPANVSCSDLEIQDPITGGTFACIACRRQWEWNVVNPSNRVFFLMALTCRTAVGSRVQIIHPEGAVLWQHEINAGDRATLCVPVEHPANGRYSLLLGGPLPLGLTTFAGSISINLYDHRGRIVEAVNLASE